MKKQLIIFSIFAIITNVAFGQIPDPSYTAKKLRGSFNFVVGNDTVKLYPEYGISLDTVYFADNTKLYTSASGSDTSYVKTVGDSVYGDYTFWEHSCFPTCSLKVVINGETVVLTDGFYTTTIASSAISSTVGALQNAIDPNGYTVTDGSATIWIRPSYFQCNESDFGFYRTTLNARTGRYMAFNYADSSVTIYNKLILESPNDTMLSVRGGVNVIGKISVTEATHLFAYFGDSTVTYSYAATDTWYHLSNATDSLWRYTEKDGFTVSNDTITISETGDYDFTATMQFEGGNGTTYAFRFYNVTQTMGIPVAGGTTGRGAGNICQTVVGSYCSCAAGDKIVLQSKADATNDATLKSSIIKIYKVHE